MIFWRFQFVRLPEDVRYETQIERDELFLAIVRKDMNRSTRLVLKFKDSSEEPQRAR